jgi:hypothetical protein
MENKFWRSLYSWPADPAGYVFLARAVERVGSAMFGSEWTGQEVMTEYKVLQQGPVLAPRRLPISINAASRHSPLSINPKGPVAQSSLAENDYETTRAIEEHNARALPALKRLGATKREIVKRCESGELVSAARPTSGGVMMVLPASHWNTEHWDNRFIMCQMNPTRPFGTGFAGDNYCWIFVTAETLDRLLLSLPFAQTGSASDIHHSPYIRLMLSVAKKLKIAPDQQPKKEVVMAELKKNWGSSIPYSENLLKAMATLLREPESQGGKALKRGKSDHKG